MDTGCSLVSSALAGHLARKNDGIALQMMDCSTVCTLGMVELQDVRQNGFQLGPLRAHVLMRPPVDVDVILGLDVLARVGFQIETGMDRVCITLGASNAPLIAARSTVPTDQQTGAQVVASHVDHKLEKPPQLGMRDADFQAVFDGRKWMVCWEWNGDPPIGTNQCTGYKVPPEAQEAFDQELQEWVHDGYLVAWDSAKHGPIKNVVPLMCVQQKKGELNKPALDFRWLNSRIKSRPAAATPLCQEELCQWRRLSNKCAVVDLRKAYLQLHLDPTLWAYQAIVWKGCTYLLTRIGFGLSIAPKVMTAVVEQVLSKDSRIAAAASSYIDDIMVDKTKVGVTHVVQHLAHFGLTTKAPEQLGGANDV